MANLFDPPGTPLGTAHHDERDRIRAHLRRRLWRFYVDEAGPGTPGMRLEARVDAIQRRLHKYDETYAVRSRRWREQQIARSRTAPEFTAGELEQMIEHFDGANDPVSAEIGRKARELLDNRDGELRRSA